MGVVLPSTEGWSSCIEYQFIFGHYELRIFSLIQIFPEANMNEESDYPEDFLYRRERLPSIVVEPTEHSEHESGELCCPPRCQINKNVEEDEEEDSHTDHTEDSVDGEQQEHTEEG
uniref:LBH domain-containing protein n=1 Tax=Acanthochromis polyacanthus TaxID=80966 RepID=A0A3Q1G8T6_9TELE